MMTRLVHGSLLTALMIGSLLFTGCTKDPGDDDDETIGNWIKSADFDGYARSEAVVFTIGDKTYLSTGATDRERFRDLWEYNAEQKYWTQKADLPAEAPVRNSAVAFTIGDKGYLGTGYDGYNRLKDFWQYDPARNEWSRKADFGGTARYDAVAFSLNNKGYIASGFDGNYLKDLWEYEPGTDTWTQRASLGGSKRSGAMAFVLGGKAYICSGSNNGATLNDLWVYDAAGNTWTEKRKISNTSSESYDDDYGSIQRSNGVAFVMNEVAYITTGETGALNTDTWAYLPATDTWQKKTAFEGSGRLAAVAFTLKNRGYVLTGRNGSISFDNMYEFFPDAAYDEND